MMRETKEAAAKLDKGALESMVMDVLWANDGWRTPGDVQEALAADHTVAYTTAMTVLTRLWNKGRVERQRQGRAYAYRPVESREEYAAERMQALLDACTDRAGALSHLVSHLGPDDKEAVKRALRRRQR